MRSLLLLLMFACAEEAQFSETAADEAAPPGLRLRVTGNATRGGHLTLQATAPAGAAGTVGFALGHGRGAGPCPPQLNGACLGITDPVTFLGSDTLGPRGASVGANVPLAAPDTLWMQAALPHPGGAYLSNVVEVTIVDGVLQAGDVCQNAPQACDAGLSCCYPCGVQGCQNTCTPTCAPGDPGCMGGCYLYP